MGVTDLSPLRPPPIDNSLLCVPEPSGSKKLPSLTNEGRVGLKFEWAFEWVHALVEWAFEWVHALVEWAFEWVHALVEWAFEWVHALVEWA